MLDVNDPERLDFEQDYNNYLQGIDESKAEEYIPVKKLPQVIQIRDRIYRLEYTASYETRGSRVFRIGGFRYSEYDPSKNAFEPGSDINVINKLLELM